MTNLEVGRLAESKPVPSNVKDAEKEPEVNYNYLGTSDTDACFPNYIERHLIIDNIQFIIIPNGGTGDCLFKAIAQAISDEDDEACHVDIRREVVDFIVTKKWDKLRDSIEIQHISGNPDLFEKWTVDPIKCYKDYMTQAGTLGSFIELTAAAGLFQFHFASIQEYSKDVKTYRVENFGEQSDTHPLPRYYFLFTGDYESGHWEHLVPLVSASPSDYLFDGTYQGTLYIIIDGVQVSLDDWLTDMEEKGKNVLLERGNGDSCSDKTDSEADSVRDHELSASANVDLEYEDTSDGEANLSLESTDDTTSNYDEFSKIEMERTGRSNNIDLTAITGTMEEVSDNSSWERLSNFNTTTECLRNVPEGQSLMVVRSSPTTNSKRTVAYDELILYCQ